MIRFQEDLALANSQNILIDKDVRISVISSKIVRVERKVSAQFIDNKTQVVFNRDYDKTPYKIEKEDRKVIATTSYAKFVIDLDTLSYKVYINGKEVKVNNRENLKGTVRTLDGNVGIVKFPNGLMSKSGLTILDDSKSALLTPNGDVVKREKGYVDFYILAFGREYLEGLKEIYNLTGYPPVVPKYALGNWWSRYHAYTDKEYLELMDKFKEKEIPFTVATVDMDWHIVKNVPKDVPNVPIFGKGWTGYTFEKEYFIDYKAFLKELKIRNLKVALNLHPKDGVRYYECQYEKMAKANGIDPKTKKPIEFDLTNPTFRDSYFDLIHHPYEKDGVDIWWIDWQQGSKSKLDGVDPLWLLNHYHYKDITREKNGIILSRFGGIGSHRYPLGFSGDTYVCWKSLKLQPYFTSTASNVGYTWWSHDIGGHMLNKGDNELYLRWLQLGAFLPINRLHSTNNTLSKEPWLYPKVEKEATKVLKFRHSLIPYLYTAAINNNTLGTPICSPMYYYYDKPIAYMKQFRNEYIFAGELLVCPITKSMKKKECSSQLVWFPNGKWINIFTGKEYEGEKVTHIKCPLNEYPVYAKEGSFIPLLSSEYNEINYQNLNVKVFLGEGSYTLKDDNGSLIFTIKSIKDGYEISLEKIGDIDTKMLNFEIMGIKKACIKVANNEIKSNKFTCQDSHKKIEIKEIER